MEFTNALIAQLLCCQVNLWHVQARLQAATDAEALHDLRIQLRRLRSLLRPLRQQADIAQLLALAAELNQHTTALRDLEVLIVQLQQHDLQQAVAVRQLALRTGYESVRASPQLAALLALLDSTPAALRRLARQGALHGSKPLIEGFLHKSCRQLARALAEPEFDRHRLRLLVKRVRYNNEIYPRQSPLSRSTMTLLKQVQAALGDWHDRYQWSLQAASQSDLQPLQAYWLVNAEQALEAAERPLQQLAKRLPRYR